MILQVIGSNSKGNSYILRNDKEALIIEAGVTVPHIKNALKGDISCVVGCIITHSHQDHCRSANQLMQVGIDVYATLGEHKKMGSKHHRAMLIHNKQKFNLGGFEIRAFDIKHDTPDPVGYLIRHADCGLLLFMTDSYYCEYNFPGLNNIIIEANYSEEILNNRVYSGSTAPFLRDRVMQSHQSIDTCVDYLKASDLSQVNNIVLVHLSDGNANAKQFKEYVEIATGKMVTIARAGMEIEMNKDF